MEKKVHLRTEYHGIQFAATKQSFCSEFSLHVRNLRNKCSEKPRFLTIF